MAQSNLDHDVIIIGAGPVGLTLALLLDAMGYKALILEHHAANYPRPRAVGIFHQSIETYEALGLHKALFESAIIDLGPEHESIAHYIGENDQVLASFPFTGKLRTGASASCSLHQPSLEQELEKTCADRKIPVYRSTTALDVRDEGSHVLVSASGNGKEQQFSARFVVGCDGANSTVRKCAGIPFITCPGVLSRWIVVDVCPKSLEIANTLKDVHQCKQYLDWKRRPTTSVPSPIYRRRWEFMVYPEESSEEAQKPEFIWKLLADFGCTPENVVLEKSALYTLAGAWAETFSKGRISLAGDAAHTTPPFLAQGLNSGLRDAAALSWRLSYALGHPEGKWQKLFQDYSNEQLGTTREAVQAAVNIEKLYCITNPEEAKIRDQMLASGKLPPPPDLTKLGGPGMYIPEHGLHLKSGPVPGQYFPDSIVQKGDVKGSLYEMVGWGWLLLTSKTINNHQLTDSFGGTVLSLDSEGFKDITGSISDYLHENNIFAVLVRPDRYVYGLASSVDDVERLVTDLAASFV